MPASNRHELPKLRSIHAQAMPYNGQPSILLRDPLRLSGAYLALPQHLAPLLLLCDGSRDLEALRASLLIRFGLSISREMLERIIDALDEALLLDNERAAQAHAEALAAYRAAPYRPAMMAGQSYPADPASLRRYLDHLLDRADGGNGLIFGQPGRGVASPHIDYPRGGSVYAALWKAAAEMARRADLVVLLGTDHYGNDPLTLTRQSYATPYGVLPNPLEITDALAEAIGPEAAYAGELRNRGEHSLELVAVWLHHMREGRPVELLPILTGSFGDFIAGAGDPAQDVTLKKFLEVLRGQMAGRQVLVVASGDLSHVGPAFGGQPLDLAGRTRIRAADTELIDHLGAGNAEGFFQAIKREQDRNNVCGVAPFYLMLRLLGDVEGQQIAYDQCPADEWGTSLVSICGMVFG